MRVFNEKNNTENFVILQEDWFFTRVKVGDYVNIIGEFSSHQYQINNKMNNLILHPDVLISGTTIVKVLSVLENPF